MEQRITEDTIKLLRECNAGIKMGVTTLNDVMDSVTGSNLKELLDKSRDNHIELEKKTEQYLADYNYDGKEPNPMAKAMGWMKTNVKLGIDNSDKAVADLITDGCNMGIKTLNKYLNEYPDADNKVKKLAQDIVCHEADLVEKLKNYL